MKPLSDCPFVCVEWWDAHGHATGEYTAEEIIRDLHDPQTIRTFGLLVHEDERGITVAQEITNPGEAQPTYRGLGFVPRGMLKELIVLGFARRPARKRVRTDGDNGTTGD